MHKDIDGNITPEEKSILKDFLTENLEADEMFNELLAVKNNLQKLPEVEPPIDLKDNILSNINTDLYSREKKINGTIIKLNSWFTQRNIKNVLAYAAVFIIGICISALVLFPRTSENYQYLNDVYGTIGANDYEALGVKQFKTVDQLGLSGSLGMKESNNIIWLESNILSDRSFTVQVFYQPKELAFVLFKPLDPEKITFEQSNNILTITTTKPFILSFAQKTKTESHLKIALNPSHSNILEYDFLIR